MIRVLFSLFLYVTVARWLYSEAKLLVPSATPVLEQVVTLAQIPTHDKWPPGLGARIVNSVTSIASSLAEALTPEGTKTDERYLVSSSGRKVLRLERVAGWGGRKGDSGHLRSL